MSVVHFSFILVSFFNNSKLAAIVAPVVLFVAVLPRYVFFGYNSNTGILAKVFASLLSPTAFALGCDIITNFEYIGIGVQPSNSGTGRYSFNTCLFMLVVDNFLYWFLGFYFEGIFTFKDNLFLPVLPADTVDYTTKTWLLFCLLNFYYWAEVSLSLDCSFDYYLTSSKLKFTFFVEGEF